MAKYTALELTNKILERIFQSEVGTIAGATGQAKIALGYLNDAILEIYNKNKGRWHTMLTNRKYVTPFDIIITVLDYTQLSGETITITYFGSSVVLTEGIDFSAVTDNATTADNIRDALIADSTLAANSRSTAVSNNNIVTLYAQLASFTSGLSSITAVSTSVTDTSVLTVSAKGVERVFTPSDFGSMYVMKDVTNNQVIYSEYAKVLDMNDPNESEEGTPVVFSLRNDHLILMPRPSSNITIKEYYWKLPSKLSSDSDLYDLPEFCETAILKVAEGEMFYYIDKTSKGDRSRGRAKLLIEEAIDTNDGMLDRIISLDASFYGHTGLPLTPPSLGSNYSRPHGF